MTRATMIRSGSTLIWAALAVLGLDVSVAQAQDQTSPQLPFRFEIGQSLRVTDNIRLNRQSQGTTTALETTGRLGYRFSDGIQTLDLEAGGVFRLLDDPVEGNDSKLSDADLALDYLREGANARFEVQSRYARRDLAFDNPLNGDGLTDQDLSTSTGTRADVTHLLGFETGLNDPFGLRANLSQRERRYSDTTDSDLFDTDTTTGEVAGLFRFGQTSVLELNILQSRYEAQNTARTVRDTRRVVLGLTHAFSEITTLEFDLGHADVEERFDAIPGLENRESGVVTTLQLSRERRNGVVSARLDSNVTQAGRRNTFEVSRRFVLPTGALSLSLGVIDGSTTDPRAIGSINYRQDWRRSSFRAVLRRTGSVSETNSTVTETTRLNIGYDLELNPISRLSVDLRHANIHETGLAADPDRQRSSLDVSLTRDLGNDWNFVTGYAFRRSDQDDTGSAHSNAVFFTLKREFGAAN
ncbi:hypothetical protein GFB49_13970 [Epibacterium sp. SM1979]|uniref:TIGR03016 family PEP-CTERM system-associated outer membrane protein n=1 Tax=Tritonibacter litoralis TaxID=2662264 RepID=A0A843YFA1_9RHOB|nr:hypothetical protein [Tritonibacter litoralis]MQQ09571.1 hypothetical protein [Tritonibacter litoralis]